MISHRAEGLLIAPVGDRSKANLVLLERRKFPLVLIDRSVAGFDCDLVQGDSVAGAKMLASHLLSVGHRRIAVIIEPDNVSTARERLLGFNAAMKAAGHQGSASHVLRTTADRAGGYAAMQQILSLEPRPSAVFAVNNMTALGAMQAIRERGLVVPKDIALVCFDDVEHLAVLSPFLTVVNQPTEMFGTLAAQLLLDRIAGDAGASTSPQAGRARLVRRRRGRQQSCSRSRRPRSTSRTSSCGRASCRRAAGRRTARSQPQAQGPVTPP